MYAKILGERLMKKKYLHRLTVSQHKSFANYKRENSNLTLRNWVDTTLNK